MKLNRVLIVLVLVSIVYGQCATRASCDPRCNGRCFSDSRTNLQCCDGCSDDSQFPYQYYWWRLVGGPDYHVCNSYCPPNYFKSNLYGTNNRTCEQCHPYCLTCTSEFNYTCTSCATNAYQLNSSACYYLQPSDNTYCSGNCWNPCIKPYYGLPSSHTCVQCPTGCSSCNIALEWEMPSPYYSSGTKQTTTVCPYNSQCNYALLCYTCSSGYTLVQGICVSTSRCRLYAFYDSTAAGFNPSFCYCLDNFFLAGSSCIKCSDGCKTCQSISATGCLSCLDGAVYTAATKSCAYSTNTTVQVLSSWGSSILPTNWTVQNRGSSSANTTNCQPTVWVFGYYGYDTSASTKFPNGASITYSYSGGLPSNHYGIRVKGKFIFIDDWRSDVGILFREGSIDRFQYNYPYSGIIGDQKCGWNSPDFTTNIEGWFAHTGLSIDLVIKANKNGFSWGVKEVVVHLLKCDVSCVSCSGPSPTDCMSCDSSTRHQILVGKDCVCDSANNYYLDVGSSEVCVTSCTDTALFKDPMSSQCKADCTAFPYDFKYTNPTTSEKKCVSVCPSSYYRYYPTKTCVSACYDSNSLTKYYNFDGLDKACYDVCPTGLYGDSVTGSCIKTCSSTPGFGYFALGSFCVTSCGASHWAFVPTRTCLTSCPTGYFKAVNAAGQKICELVCSVSLSGTKLYGDNSTGTCVDLCPFPTYADIAAHLCVTDCNYTALRQNVTASGAITRTCRIRCETATYDLYGNWEKGDCGTARQCPLNFYGDSYTTYCESNCTNVADFADNSSRKCQPSCSTGFKNNYTKMCVATCPNKNWNGDPLFGHPINRYCVKDCDGIYYADEQANRQCKPTCKDLPQASFGFGSKCVYKCSSTTWGDPNHANRLCTASCTYTALLKTYGYDQTRLCVSTCPDTTFGIVINTVPLCVAVCEAVQSLYGDPESNLCVAQCPEPYYADPTGLRLCVKSCPSGYFSQNVTAAGVATADRICVTGCAYGWADSLTRTCANVPTGCSAGYYARDSNKLCVIPTDCAGFADPVTQKCVTTCVDTGAIKYFGDRSTKTCVLVCPEVPNTFGDNSTNQCQQVCTNTLEMRDEQYLRRCVLNTACSRTPVALFADPVSRTCVTPLNCTNNYYADNSTKKCEQDCTGSVLQYADPVRQQCVAMCQLGTFALNISAGVGQCSARCPIGRWADNVTLLCTERCSAWTYGEDWTDPVTAQQFGTCEPTCRSTEFARDIDNKCVIRCGTGLWGDPLNRTCVNTTRECPTGYYADDQTSMCVVSTDCSIVGAVNGVGGVQHVADNQTNKCVAGCPASVHNFADMVKKLCVAVCPYNRFGDNTTLQCLPQCKDYTTNVYTGYADPQLRLCVSVCSASPISTFGDDEHHTCVEELDCPGQTWGEVEVYDRKCVPYCPASGVRNSNLRKYADNVTKLCVQTCPTYFYGDIQRGWGMCVSICPNTTGTNLFQFADNYTKTCVQVCPVSQNTWGDPVSRQCVNTCLVDWYAQLVPKRYCVETCSANSWGNDITRMCVYNPFQCPIINDRHYYADDSTTMCVNQCPSSPNTWGQNSTWKCVPNCLTGFKYTQTRVCIDICPAPANLDGDGFFSDAGMCQPICITANYYRDPQQARSCKPTCSSSPIASYADTTTMKCVLQCPSYPVYYFADDRDSICHTTCDGNRFKDQTSRKCVSSCPTGTFYDANSNMCVASCPYDYSNNQAYFGDPYRSPPSCVTIDGCSSNAFSDTVIGQCTTACTLGQYKYIKRCLAYCPDGLYINEDTGSCVAPTNCPTDRYADNSTNKCTARCSGSYADTVSQKCVYNCPGGNFSDPYTGVCTNACTNSANVVLHISPYGNTCISSCIQNTFLDTTDNLCKPACGSLYFADPSTSICVSICPTVPNYVGNPTTRKCVLKCDPSTALKYIDYDARVCVSVCPQPYYRNNETLTCDRYCVNQTYADDIKWYCVADCNPRYRLDTTHTCTSTCLAPYYKDSTLYKCVLQCPTYPATLYKVVDGSNRYCSTNCLADEFRDELSQSCVTRCPPSPITFADTTTGNCKAVCSDTFFAHIPSRTCLQTCPDSLIADPLTRTCVDNCINYTLTYADRNLDVPACVELCGINTFANPINLECVSQCPSYPKMYGFDNDTHRICVELCPYPYVANTLTKQCQITCDDPTKPYLDKASKTCVSACTSPVYRFLFMPAGVSINGRCVKFCEQGTFAHLVDSRCYTRCPTNYYGDTTNYTCMSQCTLGNDRFADPSTNLCVGTCPGSTYADKYSRSCVNPCPADYNTFADSNTKKCELKCTRATEYADPIYRICATMCPSNPRLLADPETQTCVESCTLEDQRFAYFSNRSCVATCPQAGLYADPITRSCVTAVNCKPGYWGFDTTRECLQVCPTDGDYFADPTTKQCVQVCPDTYFADSTTRTCTQVCPSYPHIFGRLDNKRCVQFCPDQTYADNYTRKCVAHCSTTPIQTYADNSTNLCVQECPTEPNYFANNDTYKCVFNCPSNPPMYADYSTRKCVLHCPEGQIQTFADDTTRFCVELCPDTYFMENSTHQCLQRCITGFADTISGYCVARCPANWYGFVDDRVCVQECPDAVPALYAEDALNMCVTECLIVHKTFRDPSTKRCVPICPISQGTFTQLTDRICLATCPAYPIQFADFSTRACVPVCPSEPALFGISPTNRVCSATCPPDTWTQTATRLCTTLCSSVYDTYGDNSTWSCVAATKCPTDPNTYSNPVSRLCVARCPSNPDLYADNITRKCVTQCPNNTYADPEPLSRRCVTTCPDGYYGHNNTWRCVTGCPNGQFADILLHVCVSKCSVDPIYYGNPQNNICVRQCPSSNNSYGNPLTQQCVRYQANGFSGCPNNYFSDDNSRLCVQVCPMKYNIYGDSTTWKCVSLCPPTYFSDNSTMFCVLDCPAYPNYYAQPYSRKCVFNCLAPNSSYVGSFRDFSTRKCVERCPSNPDYYSDNSTGRCVLNCPKHPLTFADYHTRRCVPVCPPSPDIYGDLSTGRCVLECPIDQKTYADPISRRCVVLCPASNNLYGMNTTRRCVPTCPSGTFADNSTRMCVAVCPRHPDLFGNPDNHICVETCPTIPWLYADTVLRLCVSRCPANFYGENTTRRCLPECPQNLLSYADDMTNLCVSRCPDAPDAWATYGENRTKTCVRSCPTEPDTFADNVTRTCLRQCLNQTNGGYAENISQICVRQCPDGAYGDITTRLCKRYCPPQWFADLTTNLCVRRCPDPFFADNSTWKCVTRCPTSQLFFGQSFDRTCTDRCPPSTFADFHTSQCVRVCPNAITSPYSSASYDTFGLLNTLECVTQCPIPLYGSPVGWICVQTCPDPWYPNIKDHRCHRCPIECASCRYTELCLTCITDYYLYAGVCMQNCPTFPVIMYANPNGRCGTSAECTPGYFAHNMTKTCVTSCPAGFYKNNTAQTCDSCSKDCIECTNSAYCLVCNNDLALWNDFKCFSYCSQDMKYYQPTGCTNNCRDGTYLNLTSCDTCSPICGKCVVQSENCLTCAEGYYLSNSLCVASCPENTKPKAENGLLICQACTPDLCRVEPLTYEVKQYVENFQYKFQLKFNQPVNISAVLSQVFAIKRVTKTRLLQQGVKPGEKVGFTNQFTSKYEEPDSSHFHFISRPRLMQQDTRLLAATTLELMDYTIIDHGDGTYDFILKDLSASSDPNMQFEFQILDPSAIQSSSGQLVSQTRTTVSIDTSQFYPSTSYNSGVYGYAVFGVGICSLMLFLTFWASNSIWRPAFDYMQLIFGLLFINIAIPPNALYAIGAFQYAALTFLPNIFSNLLPRAVFNSQINSNIYSILRDVSFLRTMGCLVTVSIVLGLIAGITALVAWKAPQKSTRKSAKKILRQSLPKKYLHKLIHLFFLPVFYIGLMNMRSYSSSQGLLGFSVFASWIFMAGFIGFSVYTAYVIYKLIYKTPKMHQLLTKAYNFISDQNVVMLKNSNHYFEHEENKVDLADASAPRINDLLIVPFEVQTKMGMWQIGYPVILFGQKFITAAITVASFTNPLASLLFNIILNIVLVVYLIVKKPTIKIGKLVITDWIYLHNIAVLILTQLLMLIFAVKQGTASTDERIALGDAIAAIILYGLSVNLVYLIYRTYECLYEQVWKLFVQTELFKLNYTVAYQQLTTKYQQQHRSLMVQTKPRKQFVEIVVLDVAQKPTPEEMVKSRAVVVEKGINLRPNKDSTLKKEITEMFDKVYRDPERSQKSGTTSDRLSKRDRERVRNKIFSSQESKKKSEPQYERVQQKNKVKTIEETIEPEMDEESHFDFEYIEEEYPEGTNMEEILKGCKAGDVIMP